MEKKFKLTEETINLYGITLYRIEAIISFGNISAGDKGGYVQKEDNLSQYGNAEVSGDAWVCGDAWVYGNAIIKNKGCESPKSYLSIGPVGDNRFITLERSVSIINAGCFSGTIEEFEQAVKDKYGDKSDYYPVIEFFKSII